MLDVDAIRRQFPALDRRLAGQPVLFADNAATSLKPQQVIDAVTRYYTELSVNVHRGVNLLAEETERLYERARRQVARLINARADEIVFVRNTTEAIHLAAHLAGLIPEDEVLCSLGEHHSNFLPWQVHGKLNTVAPGDDGVIAADLMIRRIRPSTRLVALHQVSNVTGAVQPITEILAAAREQGTLTLVDGAQSVPHLPVDVKALDCDFLAFSGHKMLGPSGTGVLYARRKILADGQPMLYGGGMVERVTTRRFETLPAPQKYEAGTPNIEGTLGLGAAAAFLRQIGMENVYRHSRELAEALARELEGIPGLEIKPVRLPHERIAIACFTIRGLGAEDVAMMLSQRFGILVRSGRHCAEPLIRHLGGENLCRISLYLYNTLDEVATIGSALRSLCSMFR